MTRFGRRDETLPDLMAEAALSALADAMIEQPDGLVVAAMNPEEFTGAGNYGSLINTHLGLSHVPSLRVETATSSGVAAVYSAFAAIASGLHKTVLVVGGEKMTHVPTPRVSEIIGRSIDPHERSYGTTMPALAGLITRAAMHRRGLTLREISQVAVKNHANGTRNPLAHFQEAETALDGRLPINTSGGLKARGHPLAGTGIAQIVELCWQLRGMAAGRQVHAQVALAHSIGGLATNNWVTLLEARR